VIHTKHAERLILNVLVLLLITDLTGSSLKTSLNFSFFFLISIFLPNFTSCSGFFGQILLMYIRQLLARCLSFLTEFPLTQAHTLKTVKNALLTVNATTRSMTQLICKKSSVSLLSVLRPLPISSTSLLAIVDANVPAVQHLHTGLDYNKFLLNHCMMFVHVYCVASISLFIRLCTILCY